jgi:L-rhamnonate dehydratase
MVDALCGWTTEYDEQFMVECRSLDLAWLEEPVPANDLAAYRRLAAHHLTPLAAGEHAYSRRDIANLIDCGVLVLQPDAGWCGGLLALGGAIRAAADAQCRVFPHGGGLLPALHVSALHADTVVPAIEFHLTVEPKRQAFWLNKVQPMDGCLPMPTAPGLGIQIG